MDHRDLPAGVRPARRRARSRGRSRARARASARRASSREPAEDLRLLLRPRACGTRWPTSSPTTARSRWPCAASTSARPACAQFLNLLGPDGIKDGELNDHVQLQVVVDVAEDGRTAKSRSRELDMLGVHRQGGRVERRHLRERVRERGRRLEDPGAALLPDVHHRLRSRLGARTRSPCRPRALTLPPDRPPTSVYEIYPEGAHSAVSLRQSGHGRGAARIRRAAASRRRGDRRDSRARERRRQRPRAALAGERRRNAVGRCGATGRLASRISTSSTTSRARTATTSTRISGTISRTCSPRTARSSSRSAASTSAANACADSCSTCSAQRAQPKDGSAITSSGSR